MCSVYSLPFGGDLECFANISLEGKGCWLIEFKMLGSGLWGKRRGLLSLWNRRQTKQCPSLRTSYEIHKHVAQNGRWEEEFGGISRKWSFRERMHFDENSLCVLGMFFICSPKQMKGCFFLFMNWDQNITSLLHWRLLWDRCGQKKTASTVWREGVRVSNTLRQLTWSVL